MAYNADECYFDFIHSFMLTTFFGRAKKVVRKKPAPELRSLIICNAQPEQNNSLRSDRFCSEVVSHTMITHYAMGVVIKNGWIATPFGLAMTSKTYSNNIIYVN